MEFVNPRPMSLNRDLRNNPVYPQGAVVEIMWTLGDRTDTPISLTLVQVNTTTVDFHGSIGGLEYITQNVVDRTSFSWIVATTKDLAKSNVFLLCLFEEGKRVADAESQFFNITGHSRDQPPDLTSTLSQTESASASATGSSTSLAPALSTGMGVHSAPASDATESQAPGSSYSSSASPLSTHLSTPAKIGIGVGVACAVLVGLVAGWLLFGRRNRRRRDQNPPGPTAQYGQYADGWNTSGRAEQDAMDHRAYEPMLVNENPNHALVSNSSGQAHGVNLGREKPAEMGAVETSPYELSGTRD